LFRSRPQIWWWGVRLEIPIKPRQGILMAVDCDKFKDMSFGKRPRKPPPDQGNQHLVKGKEKWGSKDWVNRTHGIFWRGPRETRKSPEKHALLKKRGSFPKKKKTSGTESTSKKSQNEEWERDVKKGNNKSKNRQKR